MTALARLWRWLTTPQPPRAPVRYHQIDWDATSRILRTGVERLERDLFTSNAMYGRLRSQETSTRARFEHDA